jgi:hypothetical protein
MWNNESSIGYVVVVFSSFWVSKFIYAHTLVGDYGMYICTVCLLYTPLYSIEELNTYQGWPALVFFLAPTKPLQSYGQASPHRDTVLIKSREMA